MEPTFFETPKALRAWLAKHHDHETELLVGFHKVGSGKPSITWPQSVDEALCVGWIDGVRRRIDDDSYSIRFTPRKPRSIWSAVNIERVGELTTEGRMQPAGLAAFARRDEKRSAVYSYERTAAALEGELLAGLQADARAFEFYESQAPWYRRTSAHWVTSAKKPETRLRRLAHLIDCSRRGERIDVLKPSGSATKV